MLLSGLVLGMLAMPAGAAANDHFLKVREVFAGTTGKPGTDFIELQMHLQGQRFVAGNHVHVYNSAGTLTDTFTFPADVTGTADQSSLLIATSQAATFFGLSPDLTMSDVIPAAGGKVCYEDTDTTPGIRDCVSWGDFSGDAGTGLAATGDPVNPGAGIPNGNAIERDISAGNPDRLENTDDTNDSAADFDVLPTASPRNNAGAVTDTAGTAGVAAGVFDFDAAAGVTNRLTAFRAAGVIGLRDLAAPIALGAGCTQILTNEVRCASAGITDLDLSLGDGNDVVATPSAIDVAVDGAIGNDRITTRTGDDAVDGGPGTDTLNPGTGSDLVDGGTGGADTVTYAPRSAVQPVVVDLDGVADDGNADDEVGGLRDNVLPTVERVIGGSGDDTLNGNNKANRLTGRGGADVLRGRGGNDTIFAAGDGSSDSINCGAGGADHVFADPGDTFPVAGPNACELVN